MMIFTHILGALLIMVLAGIEITTFFLIVRALRMLWPARLLLAFDAAGMLLTEYYLEITERIWAKLTDRQVTEKKKLLIGLCFQLFARLILSIFGNLIG